MTDQAVCGYCNYETFHISIFLSNNRPRHDHCRILARKALSEEFPLLWLAELLETYVEDSQLRLDARESALRTDSDRLAHDLLNASLDRVNWREIAEEWLAVAKEG